MTTNKITKSKSLSLENQIARIAQTDCSINCALISAKFDIIASVSQKISNIVSFVERWLLRGIDLWGSHAEVIIISLLLRSTLPRGSLVWHFD